MKKITKIVLTGGACGGKSSALKSIRTHFPEYAVICVPEAATLLMHAGCFPQQYTPLQFQHFVFQAQRTLEDNFALIAAQTQQPTLLVFDRGIMDGRAYCDDSVWAQLLVHYNVTNEQIYARYDGVVHMVTAAYTEHYNVVNNPMRYDTIESAIATDALLQFHWQKHPQFHCIENTPQFSDKVEHVLKVIDTLLTKN